MTDHTPGDPHHDPAGDPAEETGDAAGDTTGDAAGHDSDHPATPGEAADDTTSTAGRTNSDHPATPGETADDTTSTAGRTNSDHPATPGEAAETVDDTTRTAGTTGTAVEGVPAAASANADAIDALTRRTNLLVGLLGLLLLGTFVVIGLLFGRVASAEADAEAARTELAAYIADPSVGAGATADELAELRDDLERVEAGAALYASQIDGFREQLTGLAPDIEAGIDEAITGLRDFGESTIVFDVAIDEVIPVDTEVVIRRTVEVPIQTEIPIRQDIETTIRIDSLGGLPLDITVPVDVVVPIDLVVDIPIDETVPIQDEFPVRLDVPIEIDVGETELKNLTDSLATGLESLQDVLTSLSS